MAKKTAPLLPSTSALLEQFGERLRLARLRRGLSAKQVCERAGMTPMTLRSLERGGSGVTFGAYLSVMQVLGIEQDLHLLAQADPVGRSLQDARLPSTRASSGRAQPAPAPADAISARRPSQHHAQAPRVPATSLYDDMRKAIGLEVAEQAPAAWPATRADSEGFVSSSDLAEILSPRPPTKPEKP